MPNSDLGSGATPEAEAFYTDGLAHLIEVQGGPDRVKAPPTRYKSRQIGKGIDFPAPVGY